MKQQTDEWEVSAGMRSAHGPSSINRNDSQFPPILLGFGSSS